MAVELSKFVNMKGEVEKETKAVNYCKSITVLITLLAHFSSAQDQK